MQAHFERFFQRYNLPKGHPDLLFLKDLAKAFSNLPYENVTKILKGARESSSQDKLRGTEEVLEDHLRWNTGGTCFSLCNALQQILRRCGFDSSLAMADMHYGANIHCAIIVTLQEGRYLLDPGYLLYDPMPLPRVQSTHKTRMNTVVLQNEGDENYSLFTQEQGIQRWRYRLRTRPVSQAEFQKHWIRSFSLNSMEHVMLTRLDEAGRLYYRKDRLEMVFPDRRSSQRISIADSEILSEMFGLPSDLIRQAQKALIG